MTYTDVYVVGSLANSYEEFDGTRTIEVLMAAVSTNSLVDNSFYFIATSA